MSAPEVVTFGCRLNAFESEVMRGHATAAGLADAVIVNTCAVTGEAVRQARQAIRKLRRERPDARIVVTGCAAQLDPAGFAGMAEVDRVLGNAEKLDARAWTDTAPVAVGDIQAVRETAAHLVDGLSERARAFVQVQQGCDHRCTFCIIPFARGPNRSVPLGVVVAQVRRLVAQGIREVVLTGVDITAYGSDLPGRPTLGGLVRRLLAAVPELPRLRLSSIDPAEVDDQLLQAIAEEERLMPHLHLSVQAGDDLVLKRMKRRHGRGHVLRLVAEVRARRADVAFGADLIAGFPTESEAMFERTLALIDEAELSFLHVFPYSARQGTPAARMPQLPMPLRRERAARLRQAGAAALARFLASRIGATEQVLVEDGVRGRTAHYAPIELAAAGTAGEVVTARVDAVADGRLVAA
jgi:threonylcarbamoyladenosine tRNA methylthiotransferase MtaB